MIFSEKTKYRIKISLRKKTALFMAIVFLNEVINPVQLLALTGGPSQPEVQAFEPIGTSDMVDLSSGDFNYNIPLLDVDGYPINIAYHSGITMDQEASWVGLGWNINPGVINRNMRGLPDDFAGESVVKELNMKPNKTWGVGLDLSLELIGFDYISLDLAAGFKFNNYTGPSITKSVNIHFNVGLESAGSLNAGLGLTSSSDDGLTVQPSVGYTKRFDAAGKSETSLGISVGTAFNSRGGLQQLTISASVSTSYKSHGDKTVTTTDSNGDQHTDYKDKGSASLGNQGVGGTFDFGTQTSSPSISNSMKTYGLTGHFTIGGELWGLNAKLGVQGSFSSQTLAQTTVSHPAYGYLYSEQGQANDNALMDFNREKDGTYNENMDCLPLTNYTYDTYSVSGQGLGGSYRPFRSDVGYVFDPAAYTTNDNESLTVELGFGGYVHVGTNISVTDVSGHSGKWEDNNNSINTLVYSSKGKGNDFENVYFKEANEKTVDDDQNFYNAAGADSPVSPILENTNDIYEPVLKGFGPVKRQKRDKRTQNFSFLKRSEYKDFAVQPLPTADSCVGARPYHIAEVTTLGTDGSRYVYGIAAYNTVQKDVTFSIGSPSPFALGSRLRGTGLNANSGLIKYVSGTDNSTGNLQGIDNYFSRTTTPSYAHSYLLTSVLSPDYIDADNIRGPSDGDYGSYTRFVYQKRDSIYKWRTPYGKDSASYNEGLKSDFQDDKANYIYGEKELFYLDSVITKNYVAVFHKSYRQDGAGVQDENGGYGGGSISMLKLDSISLYSKKDLKANPTTAMPVKRVHFVYDYSLCKGISNSVGGYDAAKGKLTLKKIYFSYQNSNKARLSPYLFDYGKNNPNYNLKGYDRWGNYKPNFSSSIGVKGYSDVTSFISDSIPSSDFPYVEQDNSVTNQYAAAWSLQQIHLPSGGVINLTYESDDYAYVQNKPAMQMFKVINDKDSIDARNTLVDFDVSGVTGLDKFYFKLQPGVTDIHKYIDGIQNLYYRFLVKIRGKRDIGYDHLEYVSGYGTINFDSCKTYPTKGIGCICFMPTDIGNGTMVNPVVKSAIQYGRLYMPKKVWTKGDSVEAKATYDDANNNIETSNGLGFQVLDAMKNSRFISNIKDAIDGPNKALLVLHHVAEQFVANKSWVRLNNPNKHKLGGGLRVRKIEMIDNWGGMVGNGSETSNYGQQYSYNLDDGTSSGVASYEPQLGGDENPWKQPLPYDVTKMMVPSDEFYQEEPMGESFFPSPAVVYSKVTVKNLQRTGVSRHATGKVVHQFYTSKDFPTITKRTDVNHVRAKDPPFSLRSLFKINVRDYLTAVQGFDIELNDMAGKPKSQEVYQEGVNTPISSVEYRYQQENYLTSQKLMNKCTTIDKYGNVATNTIGEFFDMVADFREDKTETNNISIGINVDVIPCGPIPIAIPSMWPAFSKQKTRFRSATSTKVIQRFGILEETIARDLGSVVSTKNLAYNAETGGVILTQTTTNFNDKVYNFKYPAWWYYTNMGLAYENLGFEMNSVYFNAGGRATIGNASAYFREGDEVALFNSSGNIKGWVNSVANGTIFMIKRDGNPVSGTYNLKIIRSGKRNTLTTDMATITTLSNPLPAIQSNSYQNVLQASSVEFSNKRKTHCDCLTGPSSNLPFTTNPYVLGVKGSWRPFKSYTHLTGRSQSNYDNNTNIRKDGVFTSYNPFYKMSSGNWQIDSTNWTYASKVTEFNVLSQELENQDALGRFSSATFGYNQSQALSVAANSQYKDQGFDGFEDYNFNPCADDHFKFKGITPTSTESHSGKYSLKVSNGSPQTLRRQIATASCDTVSDCNLKFGLENVFTSTLSIVPILNSLPPNSTSWNIITGTPMISVGTLGGIYGVIIIGSNYVVDVTVTDSHGCSLTKEIRKN